MAIYTRLSIRPETKKLVMEDCVKEFLEYNSKFKGMNITEEFIVRRLAEHYLECNGI